ncbi:unnamed protein product [Prunus armeniaca]|uniref:Uncharacterized protein n=1 Tax=Prunus armeniaca TaxID=36596 RepID=A0A6J5TC55_PRUAR|nr:unnamed protein product [Prunus armeniaca]
MYGWARLCQCKRSLRVGFLSRVVCKSLETESSGIDEFLKLRLVIDSGAVEEKARAECDNFYKSCDASRVRTMAFDSDGGDWGRSRVDPDDNSYKKGWSVGALETFSGEGDGIDNDSVLLS